MQAAIQQLGEVFDWPELGELFPTQEALMMAQAMMQAKQPGQGMMAPQAGAYGRRPAAPSATGGPINQIQQDRAAARGPDGRVTAWPMLTVRGRFPLFRRLSMPCTTSVAAAASPARDLRRVSELSTHNLVPCPKCAPSRSGSERKHVAMGGAAKSLPRAAAQEHHGGFHSSEVSEARVVRRRGALHPARRLG